jgi:RNA polymerase sigma-70 factor, ECF subfamily
MRPVDPIEDGALMARASRGEPAAVEALFERHHGPLHRFFHRLSASPAAAEDLVQETFLRLLKYPHSFRPGGSFRAWLFGVARRAAADHFRRASRWKRAASDLQEPVDEAPLPPQKIEADERLARLHRALERISTEDREVLLLARYEDLSAAELAEALGCSNGAARVRVHRALTRLRRRYEELTEVPRHAMR